MNFLFTCKVSNFQFYFGLSTLIHFPYAQRCARTGFDYFMTSNG